MALPDQETVAVEINRGEQRHTFTYRNVVRRWVKLGVWNGKAATERSGRRFQDPASMLSVVIVRGVGPQPMLGAVFMSLDDNNTAQRQAVVGTDGSSRAAFPTTLNTRFAPARA